MIKIQISTDLEEELIKEHCSDASNQHTGLLKVLQNQESKNIIGKHPKLNCFFYDCHDCVKKQNVVKIISAIKADLEYYINLLGEYSEKDSKELVEKVFRYDSFSKRKHAYNILSKINVKVCPYCNRQYTFTLKNRKVRPQFDHYYPKSRYPYLALSFYNLIPSCSICNQAKSDLDTYINPIIYPYEEEFGDDIIFKTVITGNSVAFLQGLSQDFTVEIKNIMKINADKVDTQNRRLHLDELYNMHKDYIQDIARNHYINSSDRINEIMIKFPTLFSSKDEILKTIYMNDMRKESWTKRPLAKLTKDIYDDLEIGTI